MRRSKFMFLDQRFELNSKCPDNCIGQQSTIDQFNPCGISSAIGFGVGVVSRMAGVSVAFTMPGFSSDRLCVEGSF